MASLSNISDLGHTRESDSAEDFQNALAWWENFTSPIVNLDPNETTFKWIVSFGLPQTAAPVQETPSYQALAADSASWTTSSRDLWVKLSKQKIRNNPFFMEEHVKPMLIESAYETIHEAMGTALWTLDATAHPLNGSPYIYDAGGGTLYCADSYTLKEADGSTTHAQSNVTTTALSAAQLRTLITTHWKYVGWHGKRIGNFNAVPVIIAPIDLIATTDNLEGVITALYDGTGVITPVTQYFQRILKYPGAAPDTNDYHVIFAHTVIGENGPQMVGPIRPWIKFVSGIMEQDDHSFTRFGVEVEYGIVTSPYIHFQHIMGKVA